MRRGLWLAVALAGSWAAAAGAQDQASPQQMVAPGQAFPPAFVLDPTSPPPAFRAMTETERQEYEDLGRQAQSALEQRDWNRARSSLRWRYILELETYGIDHPQAVWTAFEMARIDFETGWPIPPTFQLGHALPAATQRWGERDRRTLMVADQYVRSLVQAGRHAEAEKLARQAQAIAVETLGERDDVTIGLMTNLGISLSGLARSAEAEPVLRRALALLTERRGPRDPYVFTVMATLGKTLVNLDRNAEAAPLLRGAVVQMKEVGFGNDAADTSLRLATALDRLGQRREAASLRASVGPRRSMVRFTPKSKFSAPPAIRRMSYAEQREYEAWASQASNAEAGRRWSDAASLWERILAREEATLGPDHPAVIRTLDRLGRAWLRSDRPDAAEPMLRRAMSLSAAAYAPDDWEYIEIMRNFGKSLIGVNRPLEAEPVLRRALESSLTAKSRTAREVAPHIAEDLAGVLERLGRQDEARAVRARVSACAAGRQDCAERGSPSAAAAE